MNVVHIFPYPARISGGHSNAIRAFIACQRRAGLEAVAISPKPETPLPETPLDFPMAEVETLWTLRWETLAREFACTTAATVVHFHSIDRRFTPFLEDLRRTGVPYVLTSHGQLGIQTVARWFKKFVYLNFVDRGIRNAAGIHVLTTLVSKSLKYVLPGWRGPVLVQGNLIAPPDLTGLPLGRRSDYDIPPDAFVLLYLGRLDVDIKGLDLVVEAFSYLPGDRFCLVFAGPDWQNGKARLETLAEQLGCRKQLRFPGPIYGNQKWQLLRLADIYVSPSRREAFSVSLVEAMACGLPVVTSTNVNLAPDLMADGTALACPTNPESLASAIMALATDYEGRQTLGSNGKTWVEANCNVNRAGVHFRSFYEQILASRPTTSPAGK